MRGSSHSVVVMTSCHGPGGSATFIQHLFQDLNNMGKKNGGPSRNSTSSNRGNKRTKGSSSAHKGSDRNFDDRRPESAVDLKIGELGEDDDEDEDEDEQVHIDVPVAMWVSILYFH